LRKDRDVILAASHQLKASMESKNSERKIKLVNNFVSDDGDIIEEYDDGSVYVNYECVAEGGTDEQFDRYASEIMNGEGYYDEIGKYRSYYSRTSWGDDNEYSIKQDDSPGVAALKEEAAKEPEFDVLTGERLQPIKETPEPRCEVIFDNLPGNRTALKIPNSITPYAIVTNYNSEAPEGQKWDSAYDYYPDVYWLSRGITDLDENNIGYSRLQSIAEEMADGLIKDDLSEAKEFFEYTMGMTKQEMKQLRINIEDHLAENNSAVNGSDLSIDGIF